MKKFCQVLSTALLMVSTPIVVTSQSSSTKGADSVQKLLGDTTYSSIISPNDFKGGGMNLVKGRPISEGVTLRNAGNLMGMTPETAMKAAGQELKLDGPLSQIKALRNFSLESIIAANPEVSNMMASAVGWTGKAEATLGELAATELGKLPLPDQVLTTATVKDFGRIAQTPLSNYPGVENMTLDKLPELANTPLSNLYSIPSSGPNIHLISVNKILTGQKNGKMFAQKVVTGSDQRPKAQWDKQTPVTGVELTSAISKDPNNLVNGAVAITGSTLMIPGGNVPSPLQPTALPIPNTPLAVSFENVDAKKGSAKVQLNLRLEYGFGLKTAYFIPLPTPVELTEKDGLLAIPVQFEAPGSIKKIAGENTQLETQKAVFTPPVSEENKPIEKPLPLIGASSSKSSEIGSAVKSATDPVSGVTY